MDLVSDNNWSIFLRNLRKLDDDDDDDLLMTKKMAMKYCASSCKKKFLPQMWNRDLKLCSHPDGKLSSSQKRF